MAWIEINANNHWDVYASTYKLSGFGDPVKVSNSSGKACNPRIIACGSKTGWYGKIIMVSFQFI